MLHPARPATFRLALADHDRQQGIVEPGIRASWLGACFLVMLVSLGGLFSRLWVGDGVQRANGLEAEAFEDRP
jgi:hypothetical protein